MTRAIAVLATLDTKDAEAEFIRRRIEETGDRAIVIDMGVLGKPGAAADFDRSVVAAKGGTSLASLLDDPSRERAAPVMVAGATSIMKELLDAGEVHAVIGMGGTQGTASATAVMRSLPYGFPKIMVSTVASGDTAPYVGVKDITMMFSVGDILGLNPFTRNVLAQAVAAARGMARVERTGERKSQDGRPVIGMTNLGVLTDGAKEALRLFEDAGYEVIVFHAVGSGGRAMEQMMKEGIIGAVFDYALGEIADDLHGGLRAGGPERLTVAAALGLPQVLCPGGAEHLGLLVDPPGCVPEAWKDHAHVFHSPVIFVPRLDANEMRSLAGEIADRLAGVRGRCRFMIPEGGTSRYSAGEGPLRDVEADRAFFDELGKRLPKSVEIERHPGAAEDPEFIRCCVERLITLIEV